MRRVLVTKDSTLVKLNFIFQRVPPSRDLSFGAKSPGDQVEKPSENKILISPGLVTWWQGLFAPGQRSRDPPTLWKIKFRFFQPWCKKSWSPSFQPWLNWIFIYPRVPPSRELSLGAKSPGHQVFKPGILKKISKGCPPHASLALVRKVLVTKSSTLVKLKFNFPKTSRPFSKL